MAKKSTKDLPTVERMEEMGFQDGYSGVKSRENSFLTLYVKWKIKPEQIKMRILSYCYGYKKGHLVMMNGLSNCKIIDGELTVNGIPVRLEEDKSDSIETAIKESTKTIVKKKRRY